MQGQIISLYLDHPKVGCGWRRYLVLRMGRIHSRLLSIETADAITVPISHLAGVTQEAIKPTRVARRLREVANTYDRAALSRIDDAAAAKRFSWPRTRNVKAACRLLRKA